MSQQPTASANGAKAEEPVRYHAKLHLVGILGRLYYTNHNTVTLNAALLQCCTTYTLLYLVWTAAIAGVTSYIHTYHGVCIESDRDRT